jgi:membrane fusion protein, copper/silver efflux system
MTRGQTLLAAVAAVVIAAAGFGAGRMTQRSEAPPTAGAAGKPVLYWYDPMYPAQHFGKPGKSPFMDMQLLPKYVGETGAGEAGLAVDPARTQSLGLRLATVERGVLPSGITATGAIDFNERDIAIVQAKAAGFVQRVYGRAPGDVVGAGAPLADIFVPEWAGAQGEFLAVRRTGDQALIRAARRRLQLLGMSPSLIASVEQSGRVRNVVTVSTPTGGAITTLGVRNGMTVSAGQTLAEVNGLSRVWLNVAVPEAQAGEVRLGQSVTARLAAYPGEVFVGRVTAILPQTETATRTLTARVELPSSGGTLRPGMFATAEFGGIARPALLVPSEAVIRTGRRTLVMVSRPGGKYLPAEVRVGREASGRTEVLAGLAAGEQVVASGQFLLDSEANLAGLQARPAAGSRPAAAAAVLYESRGRVEQIGGDRVTLSHGPVPGLKWPAMTMQFRLSDPALARGIKAGDQVAFGFEQTANGPVVRRLSLLAAR